MKDGETNLSLYAPTGQRLYLTQAERTAFIRMASKEPLPIAALCHTLAFTGCRISEALSLAPRHIDLEERAIIFECLKKRGKRVFRPVPVPSSLIDQLRVLQLGYRYSPQEVVVHITDQPRLWPVSRTTAYRWVKRVMTNACIIPGPHRCPKGLRHGFGVAAVLNGVPLTKLQSWMGHSRLETVAIYTNAIGAEERALARSMWEV